MPPVLFRGSGHPLVLNQVNQLLVRKLGDARRAEQDRRMSVKVARREKGRPRIPNERLLLELCRHPEHDHVGVALPGHGIGGVGSRRPEEDERLSANLVDRIVRWSSQERDVWHGHGDVVYVREAHLPVMPSRGQTVDAGDHRVTVKGRRGALEYVTRRFSCPWAAAAALPSGSSGECARGGFGCTDARR